MSLGRHTKIGQKILYAWFTEESTTLQKKLPIKNLHLQNKLRVCNYSPIQFSFVLLIVSIFHGFSCR